MRTAVISLLASILILEGTLLGAEPTKRSVSPAQPVQPFDPFTGKITRNRVRLRAGPDLASPILSELNQGELVGVIGDEDTFYAVKPPKEIKAYIYRTYVLANTVDGTQVNVRSEPSLEAPIIAQLNKGDVVEGKVSAVDGQWLEIALPKQVKFYIAKDYIQKAGPAELYDLSTAEQPQQTTIQQPPQQTLVESAAQPDTETPQNIEALAAWLPNETKLFQEWLADHPQGSMDDWYSEERQEAVQLRGLVQGYPHQIRNKPGNYLLINHLDNQPIAFLYSTQVDLKSEIGQVVTLVALPRPNNNFAFPTFFVVSKNGQTN